MDSWGISWDGWACQGGDWANTELKAELTEDSRKASLVIATRLWLHMRGAKLREGSWGTAPEPKPGRSWQHSIPREGYTLKWEFSCPTCLSCKTAAALENCNHLIISSSGIFRVPSASSISLNRAQKGTKLPFSSIHGRAE